MFSNIRSVVLGLALSTLTLTPSVVSAQSAERNQSIDLARDVESAARHSNASEATFREVSDLLRTALSRLNGGSSGGGNTNCAGRLSTIHSGWGSDSLRAACEGAGADCVVTLAGTHSGWGSDSLNAACRGDFGNCAGRLSEIHSGWGSDSLRAACNNADADCVIDIAQTHSGWGSDSLNAACRR